MLHIAQNYLENVEAPLSTRNLPFRVVLHIILLSALIAVLFFAIYKYGSDIDQNFIDNTSRNVSYLISLFFCKVAVCIATWELSGSIIISSVMIIISVAFFICKCNDIFRSRDAEAEK